MFRRFGPYNLFPLTESKFDFDDTELSSDLEANKNRSSKDWKVLRLNLKNIEEVAYWVFTNRKEIISTFPRTAAGEIVKNRHLKC